MHCFYDAFGMFRPRLFQRNRASVDILYALSTKKHSYLSSPQAKALEDVDLVESLNAQVVAPSQPEE